MFDDITPEEEALYLGYGANPLPPPPPPPQKTSRHPATYDEEYDAIDAYAVPPQKKASFKRPAPKTDSNLLEEEEEEEDEMHHTSFAPVPQTMLKDDDDDVLSKDPIMNMDWQVPIRRMGPRPVVPCEEGMAAETLVHAASREGGQRITLSSGVQSEIQKLTKQVDEFTQIDPLVVVSTNLIVSDSFRAYLEETMPISKYLLARALHARFNVVISAKTKTRPVPFDDPNLLMEVTPFLNKDDRGQSFNIDDCIGAAEPDEDKLLQIRAYMISLGKLSPRQTCDLDFLDEQQEMFKSILTGETVIVKPRQKKKIKR